MAILPVASYFAISAERAFNGLQRMKALLLNNHAGRGLLAARSVHSLGCPPTTVLCAHIAFQASDTVDFRVHSTERTLLNKACSGRLLTPSQQISFADKREDMYSRNPFPVNGSHELENWTDLPENSCPNNSKFSRNLRRFRDGWFLQNGLHHSKCRCLSAHRCSAK